MIIIKKLNNKGFMLIEVLAGATAILVIFMAIYQMMLPSIAEYEKRFSYTNISDTYNNYYLRKYLLNTYFKESSPVLKDGFLVIYQDNNCLNSLNEIECNYYFSNLDVEEAIITNYDFNYLNYHGVLSDYISYLKKDSTSNDNYRLIIKTTKNTYTNSKLLLDNITKEEEGV